MQPQKMTASWKNGDSHDFQPLKIVTVPIFIIFIFFTTGSTAFAQDFGDPGAIPLTISPEFPKPQDTVTITIEDYSPNFDRINVGWYVDGAIIQEGVGLRQFSIRMGALGSATTVLIRAGGHARTVVLRPAHVDLLSEAAESYTPPFYRGKALPAHGARVKIVAFPFLIDSNGKKIPPETLVYTWRQNGNVLGNNSGYGKSAIIIANNSILQQETIVSVEVTSRDNETKGSGAILVAPVEPEIVFYEDHPLLGVRFDQALPQQYPLGKDELTVLAVPYFFGVRSIIDNSLKYDWRMNGSAIGETPLPQKLVLRNEGGSGISGITLTVSHLQYILEAASAGFQVVFEESGSNILNPE